jgi:SAM-dependent methyltransferase
MDADSYSGASNLEVMLEAINYNDYLLEQVVQNARGSPNAIDFGAGTGTFSRALRERGIPVICIEPDRLLRGRLKRDGFKVFGQLSDLGISKAEYVFSLNVLEHIQNDLEALRQIYNVLVPNGRFYLFVPAFDLLYSSMDQKVGHFRRYRKGQLIKKLQAAGYRIESARYVDSLGFFASLMFKMFGNKNGDINSTALRFYDRMIFPISRVLDRALYPFLGKNLAICAVRPSDS